MDERRCPCAALPARASGRNRTKTKSLPPSRGGGSLNEMTLSSRHRIRNSSPGGWGKEMNRALGHLCAHIGQTGPGEPPEDGEMGFTHFCFFQTAETENRTANSSVIGSGANHYPRAPAQNMLGPPTKYPSFRNYQQCSVYNNTN